MPTDVNLVGHRLRIRRARVKDAETLYGWFANPEVPRYLPFAGQGCLPMESIRAFLSEASSDDQPALAVGIDLLNGRAIGCGGFRNFKDASAELSLVLGEPDVWGQGCGAEAMDLLVGFAFGPLQLAALWLMVRADNARGVRLFERSGFATVEGAPRDKLRLSWTRKQWDARSRSNG